MDAGTHNSHTKHGHTLPPPVAPAKPAGHKAVLDIHTGQPAASLLANESQTTKGAGFGFGLVYAGLAVAAFLSMVAISNFMWGDCFRRRLRKWHSVNKVLNVWQRLQVGTQLRSVR